MTHIAKHTFTRRPFLLTLLSATLVLAACGGGGGGGGGSSSGSSGGGSVTPSAPPLVMESLTGHFGGPGNADGTGTRAAFNGPSHTAVDSAGNLYVTDSKNRAIRKISPAGVVTTLTSDSDLLDYPAGIAVDNNGVVFVASGNKVLKISATGAIITFAGGTQGNSDGVGTAARFKRLEGLAIHRATGTLYVTDSSSRLIRQITQDGEVTTLAGVPDTAGSTNGPGSVAKFDFPLGIAVDSSRTVYVADTNNCTIRKIDTSSGSTVVSTVAGATGNCRSTNGTGSAAGFDRPTSLVSDAVGNLTVSDGRVVRLVSNTGVVTSLAGDGDTDGNPTGDGQGSAASFYGPKGLSRDEAGNVYVADSSNHTIRKIDPTGLTTTVAGLRLAYGIADGTLAQASYFSMRSSMAFDSQGNMFVPTEADGAAQIRKITLTGLGNVTKFAGSYRDGGSTDGIGEAARFSTLADIAVDSQDNLYVADNRELTLRKITSNGTVTTLAGSPRLSGSTDATGSAARFAGPSGVAVASDGNVYVADSTNHTIRKITSTGEVSTLAGLAGSIGSDNGTGSIARFRNPAGLALDKAGNLFVADDQNWLIRKINLSTGMVSTYAGTGGAAGNRDGKAMEATFDRPTSLAMDAKGNLYVSDQGSYTIRKITPEGDVSTIVGTSGKIGYQPGNQPSAIRQRAKISVHGNTLYIAMATGIAVVRNLP